MSDSTEMHVDVGLARDRIQSIVQMRAAMTDALQEQAQDDQDDVETGAETGAADANALSLQLQVAEKTQLINQLLARLHVQEGSDN